jgi:hypothetical protein
MNESYIDYIQTTHSIFEKRFTEAYRQANTRRRARLLPFISTIYRRWLYSALMEETLLTPANLIESINREFDQPPGNSPVIRLRSETRFNGTSIEMRDYTIEKHPVLEDIKIAVEFCIPSVELCEDDSLPNEKAAELAARLSLWDPHYASYLINIAMWMKLLTKIPSIYSNRAQVTKNYEERLSTPAGELFAEIVEASIVSAAFNLNDLIPLPEPVFGESFLRSILKKPMVTDEVFQRAYELLGVSLEDMMDMDEEDDFSLMDAAFLSGTFMMGIALDKFFYTPFSYYLKLIRPVYILPFDFESEIVYFLDSGFEDDELSAAFFAPCSKYFFTDLGIQYFNIKPNRDNYLDIAVQLPFPPLREGLFHLPGALDVLPARKSPSAIGPMLPVGQVYSFKIRNERNIGQWMVLEMPAEATLHRLYQEIAICFGLTPMGGYSFFHDETENPFAEYTSAHNTRRAKKTAETSLTQLDFQHQQNLLLLPSRPYDPFKPNSNGEGRFSVKVMETKPKEIGRAYPAIMRMSKALRAYFEEEE